MVLFKFKCLSLHSTVSVETDGHVCTETCHGPKMSCIHGIWIISQTALIIPSVLPQICYTWRDCFSGSKGSSPMAGRERRQSHK